jgi:hypothetical protein
MGQAGFLLFAVRCWIVFMIVLCRYTVAAVALGQLSFADCVRHKAIVMEVATTEAREGGNPMLGVFYDAEARAFWADEAAKLGDLVSISSKLEASRFLVWVICSCHCGWLAGAERHDFASCTLGSERSQRYEQGAKNTREGVWVRLLHACGMLVFVLGRRTRVSRTRALEKPRLQEMTAESGQCQAMVLVKMQRPRLQRCSASNAWSMDITQASAKRRD